MGEWIEQGRFASEHRFDFSTGAVPNGWQSSRRVVVYKSKYLWIVICTLWAVLAAGCSDDKSSGTGPRFMAEGTTAQIGKGGSGIPCFPSQDALHAFIKAQGDHDAYGMAEAVGNAPNLRRGDHVRVISTGGLLTLDEVKIRLESGDAEGNACWEPSQMDGFFVNIHDPQ